MIGRVPVLEDLPPVGGRSVLVRVDFNVPIGEVDGRRVVTDDFRMRQAIPTLQWLLDHGASVTCATHLGRPKGGPDPRYDVGPVREHLAELVPGVELLENLRFDPGEEANDPAFVDKLVAGHDCYVNDAFGSSHRAHASIVGPPQHLPSAAGRLLAREVEVIGGLLDEPRHPFVAIIGGAKVADKLGVLVSLIARADTVLIGGGMSYTFLAARGRGIGSSIFDAPHVDACRGLLDSTDKIMLPTDVVVIGPGGTLHPGAESVPEGDPIDTLTGDFPAGWEGRRHRARDPPALRRGDRRRRDGLLERPGGRFRGPALRGRDPRGRRSGRRLRRVHRRGRRRLGRGDRRSSGSPGRSASSRPAGAHRSSSSSSATCPGWPRCAARRTPRRGPILAAGRAGPFS